MEGSRARRPSGPARHGRVGAIRLLVVLAVTAALLPDGGPDAPRVELATEHVAGSLDTSFDDDGIAITEITSFLDVKDAETQTLPDGTQRTLALERFDDEVWRLHPDGTLDTTFDDDGVLPLPPDVASLTSKRLAVYADGTGRFVIGGRDSFGDPSTLAVARFLADGTPDVEFGPGGGNMVAFTGGAEPHPDCVREHTFASFADVGVLGTGEIVVVGPGTVQQQPSVGGVAGGQVPFGGNLVLARVTGTNPVRAAPPSVLMAQAPEPCGTPTGPGVVIVAVDEAGVVDRAGGTPEADLAGLTPGSLTVAEGDAIVVSASTQAPLLTAIRYEPTLANDAAFGDDGVAEPTDDGAGPEPLPVVVQTDGSVAVAARTLNGPDPVWVLARWNGTGTLASVTDVAFGPDVDAALLGDMELGAEESFVAIGEAVGPDALAIVTFTPDGDADELNLVDGPQDPPTGVAGVALSRVDAPSSSLRVVGTADPQVLGLDNHRPIMLARLDLTGTLDTSFGGGGFALHHGRYGESAEAVVVRPDGRIDAAGRIPITGTSADPPAGFVLRHMVDGALDATFAPVPYAGIKITCVPEDVSCAGADYPMEVHGLALDDEGRAVIAGDSHGSGIVHRVLPTPDPIQEQDFDPAFNTGDPFDLGTEFDPPGEEVLASVLHDVVVDNSGRPVAVGHIRVEDCDGSVCSVQQQVVVVRLDADGSLDETFGGGTGVVRLAPPGAVPWEASGAGIELDSSERIVLTGWSQPDPDTTTPHLLVARLSPDGTGDGSFATHEHLGDGVRLGPPRHLGHDVVTREDAIVVAGAVHTFALAPGGDAPVPARDGFVTRLTGTAEMDPGFGPDGTGIVFPFGSEAEHSTARGVALDAVGNVLVAGGSLTRVENDGFSFEATDVLLARLLSTGAPDAAFDDDGRITTDVGLGTGGTEDAAQSQAADVAVAPDGKIVVTGHVADDRGSRAMVARYNPGVTTLDCVPDPVDLGGVEIGNSNTAGITCSPSGGTVAINNLGVDPAFGQAADFSVDPGTCGGATLFADQTCDLTITFSPTAQGDRTASLAVTHTTVTGAPVMTVGLQGRGTRSPGPGEPGFVATPNPLMFGDQLVGTTGTTRTVTATNVGSAPLTISDTSLVGARPDDYALAEDSCTAATLAPDDSCTVDVTFSPVAGSGQVRPAQLQFADSAAGSPHMVALRGTVVVATLELDPDEGPIETEVTATGTGFEPGTTVELSMGAARLATIPGSDVATTGFTTTFSIPEGTPGGLQDVLACQRCDATDAVEATAPFEVTPRLFVQPTISRPGGVVSARGDGFPAGTPVTLDWHPGVGRRVVTADAAGEFTVPVLVFRRDTLGSRQLQASISGSDGIVATVPFLAVPGSTQPGGFQIRR